MNRPSFFIIGAPKCATTALYTYLKDHPKIFMPEKKEPHYFTPELSDHFVVERELDAYLNLFSDAGDDQISGEASVMYLQSEKAVARILEFNPGAKIIVMLRNPIEASVSMHLQNIKARHEDEDDFLTAWNLQDDRAQGRYISKKCGDPDMLQYKTLYALGDQLERVMNIVPVGQLKIIIFDDFKADTKKIYEETIEFLGLSNNDQSEFKVVNATTSLMSPLLEKRLAKIRANKVPVIGPLLYLLTRLNIYYVRPLLRPNYVPPAKAKPNSEVYDMLSYEFEEQINKIAMLLNRDLSHWITKYRG